MNMNQAYGMALATVLTAALGVPTASLASAASEQQDRPMIEDVQDGYDAAKQYGYDRKQDVVRWLRAREAQMDRLQERAATSMDEAGTEAQQEWRQAGRTLERGRQLAGEKLNVLEEASSDAWEALKQDVIDAYRELEEAYQGFGSNQ